MALKFFFFFYHKRSPHFVDNRGNYGINGSPKCPPKMKMIP